MGNKKDDEVPPLMIHMGTCECGHPFSGMSEEAKNQAYEDHLEYISRNVGSPDCETKRAN